MTLNERILDFMDGTLPAEEEAELLHILSVSPERRNLLRSFMNQTALFQRDRQSIQVPYQAEQKLWERLGPLMPALPVLETAAGSAAAGSAPALTQTAIETAEVTTGRTTAIPIPISFFGRLISSTSAAVGAVTLMLGLGLGYVAGTNNVTDRTAHSVASRVNTASHQNESPSLLSAAANNVAKYSVNDQPATARIFARRSMRDLRSLAMSLSPFTSAKALSANGSQVNPSANVLPPTFALPLLPDNKALDLQLNMPTDPIFAEPAEEARITPTALLASADMPRAMDRIGGEDGNRPLFLHSGETPTEAKSFLERFEFSFTESFGRQYPNSIATNTTLPIITNSAVGAFFQVLPRSSALWVGASYGTANITRKNLTTHQHPLDPLETVLSSDTVHAPTSYLAAYLQYRIPLSLAFDLTMTGGYGAASIGKMFLGELGLHYNVSREVGFQLGVRALEFTYDLTQQFNDAVNSGKSSLVISKGVSAASPSYNVEINTGLFFHF